MAVAMMAPVEPVPVMASAPRAGFGRQRKIGLLGSHGATLEHAPWHDSTWELWGHASSRGWYRRAPDRYFDLHRRECWSKSNQKGAAYLRWLATQTVPIFMQERFPEVPASIRYPLERVVAEFRPYLTGHAAYMIALALTEGVTHLGFFGVNYGKTTAIGADCEYGVQRGSCEYYMGIAEALGVRLVLPKGSTLLADPAELYGYASHDADGLLVESYRQRTWLRPTESKARRDLDASGRVKMPPEIQALADRERADYPPPVGSLGPLEPVLA